ncbi:hypothetical protein ACTXT7_013678 [Hymenolepis weldensis]
MDSVDSDCRGICLAMYLITQLMNFALIAHTMGSDTQIKDLIPDTTITNEVNRYAVIVSIKAEHSYLKIARFLKVATSFLCTVRKELLNDNNADELAATHSLHSLSTPEFVTRVHDMIDENGGKSMRDILPNMFKCLKEQ